MIIDMDQVRSWLSSQDREPPDAWSLRRESKGALPNFVFGTVDFWMKTDSHPGLSSLLVSFSSLGRFLGHIEVPICVVTAGSDPASLCGNPPAASQATAADWSLLTAASEQSTVPAAALHVIAPSNGLPTALFWCPHCGRSDPYLAWQLDDDVKHLAGVIAQALNPADESKNDSYWELAGCVLYGHLFPTPDGSIDPTASRVRYAARQAMTTLALSSLAKENDQGSHLPLFSARIITTGSDPELRIPMGLINVRYLLHDQCGAPQVDEELPREFLGFHFIFELPLPQQTYSPSPRCITNWRLAYPDPATDKDLLAAVEQAGDVLKKWENGIAADGQFHDIGSLRGWLAGGQETDPSALVIVSHYDASNQAVFFEQKGPAAPAGFMKRYFPMPSFALLDACSTGSLEPDRLDLVSTLNQQGIAAAIVTTTTAKPSLAAQFLTCFDKQLDATYEEQLSALFVKTLRCIRDSDDPDYTYRYGADALTYLLVGDGNIRLCSPALPERKE
ncbi:MAG: hypothetical protein JF614_30880 [Acidobacteria bacterium]|nr:hypothetical protein [Acidobacteriota bacterium]